MKIRFATLALALVVGMSGVSAAVVSVAAPNVPVAHAAAMTRSDTSGSITGTVVNGTHGSAPVPGQAVTLQVSVNSGKTQNAGTATTDTGGHFSFTGLDASGGSVYALDTHFQGGDFGSGAITFSAGTAQQVTLPVYDTNSSDAAIKVSVATVLFSQPNKQAGTIRVGEFISFVNSATTAFLGTTAPANGMPMGLLRFALPDGATNLTVGQGFANTQVIQVGSGFGATATLPPGTTQFAFVFDVPYTGTDYVFSYKTEYATDSMVVLVPTNILTDARDFTAKPPVDALGQKYQLLQASNVKSGAQLSTRLWNLPLAGEQPDLDFRWLLALVGALTALLALLLGLYLKRGNLAVALGLLPPAALADRHAVTERSRVRQQNEAERKRLLKALLALDGHRAAGDVDERTYQRRRTELRDQLKALLVRDRDQLTNPVPQGEAASAAENAPATAAASKGEQLPASQSRKRQAVGGRR